MPITAAVIEPNGWVLKLTLSGASLGSFASYVFDTGVGQTPRVALTTNHAGFTPSAGVAIAGTITRTLYGGYAVRKPMAIVDPAPKVVDEVDLGGGVITCRIALSEWVYATDTGLTLATLAGWRIGEAAQSAIAVTNGSTAVAPIPIMRWVLPQYDLATGSFRLSLLVGSHHPVGFQAVAGVKFTATDGINTKTVWTTALATDNSYGDNLRCYTVLVDPSTATALTEGLLRCDAEVYPFLGTMRSTDPLGTRSMTGISTVGNAVSAQTPFIIAYDPTGTRYANYAYLDPVSGSTTPAAGMIQNSRALAKAVAAASRPRDMSVAIQALRLKGRSLANAARGGVAVTNSIDGLVCTLAPGIHGFGLGTFAVGSPANLNELPVVVEGDPTDSDPRNNCILRTQATASASRASRIRFRNITMEVGDFSFGGGIASIYYDGVTMRAKAGSEAGTQSPFAVSGGTGTWTYCYTNSRFWRMAWNMRGQNNGQRSMLWRACQFSKPVSGIVFVKNRWIGATEDGIVNNTGGAEGISPWATTAAGDLGASEDVVMAFNDFRYVQQAVFAPTNAATTAANAGTTFSSVRRQLLLNNLIEAIYYPTDPTAEMFNYGESQVQTISYNIIEGNTCVGAGYNGFYNNPLTTTLVQANTLRSEAFFNRHANNATDRNASKQDDFDYGGLAALRGGGTANGFRPQLIDGWAGHMGTGMEAHVDFSRQGSYTNFRRDFVGLRGVQYAAPTTPGFASDRSKSVSGTGPGGFGAGGGDYTPTAGSPLLGRVTRANSDLDFAGNARKLNGAAGAFEALGATIDLGPVKSTSATRAAVTPIGLQLTISAMAARSLQTARAAVVGVALALAPAGSRLAMVAGATSLAWRTTLTAAGARQSIASASPAVGITVGTLLRADNSRLALGPGATLVLPLQPVAAERTLLVRSDPRIESPD